MIINVTKTTSTKNKLKCFDQSLLLFNQFKSNQQLQQQIDIMIKDWNILKFI